MEKKKFISSKQIVHMSAILFMSGMILAVGIGLLTGAKILDVTETYWGYIAGVLVLLGIIIGLKSIGNFGSITQEEYSMFLISSIAILVVGIAGQLTISIPLIGFYIYGITLSLTLFFGPIAILLSLKTLWDIGKD